MMYIYTNSCTQIVFEVCCPHDLTLAISTHIHDLQLAVSWVFLLSSLSLACLAHLLGRPLEHSRDGLEDRTSREQESRTPQSVFQCCPATPPTVRTAGMQSCGHSHTCCTLAAETWHDLWPSCPEGCSSQIAQLPSIPLTVCSTTCSFGDVR